MGLSQSSQGSQLDEEEEEEEEEEEGDEPEEERHGREREEVLMNAKAEQQRAQEDEDELEQEPEWIPFEASASPLSPQSSALGSPHLGSAVRAWDACHLLNPLPSHALSLKARSFSNRSPHTPPGAYGADDFCIEIFLIRHAQSNMNALPDLIAGRCPSAMLTSEGKRQARALGVFLLSQGLHFDAVFASPLERCKQTAISVCQEVNFPQEKIQYDDALMEMSQGEWEGLPRSEVYTADLLKLMANSHPDFRAPGGESQRQVEFRMIEFLNNSVLPRAAKGYPQVEAGRQLKRHAKTNTLMQVHPLDDDENGTSTGGSGPGNRRHSLSKGSGKSRLQLSSIEDNTVGEASIAGNGNTHASLASLNGRSRTEVTLQRGLSRAAPFYVGIFSHGMSIKCLLRGILGSDPRMTHKLHIDNTSMTVLRQSPTSGWQIQRVNDTAHLRLL